MRMQMDGRTFSWQPMPKPRLFETEDKQPTKSQVISDRAARDKMRADARRQLLATGRPSDDLAVQMAQKGYGIETIHQATSIARYMLRQLVLGE